MPHIVRDVSLFGLVSEKQQLIVWDVSVGPKAKDNILDLRSRHSHSTLSVCLKGVQFFSGGVV